MAPRRSTAANSEHFIRIADLRQARVRKSSQTVNQFDSRRNDCYRLSIAGVTSPCPNRRRR